jgi:hypothetical protein
MQIGSSSLPQLSMTLLAQMLSIHNTWRMQEIYWQKRNLDVCWWVSSYLVAILCDCFLFFWYKAQLYCRLTYGMVWNSAISWCVMMYVIMKIFVGYMQIFLSFLHSLTYYSASNDWSPYILSINSREWVRCCDGIQWGRYVYLLVFIHLTSYVQHMLCCVQHICMKTLWERDW